VKSPLCIKVTRRVPYFHTFVTLNIVFLWVLFAIQRLIWADAMKVGLGLMLVWNGYLLWRVLSSERTWVLAADTERFYLRMSAPFSGRLSAYTDADVMVLDASEVASVGIRSFDVFVSGPKPQVREFLVVTPEAGVRASVAEPLDRLYPPGAVPVPFVDRFARYYDGDVWVPWTTYTPALRVLISQIQSRFPGLTIARETRSELDLISYVSKREPERRRLLAQAKRMGFGRECMWALRSYTPGTAMYSSRSLRECREYVESLDISPEQPAP
jgi:hypothetical protein